MSVETGSALSGAAAAGSSARASGKSIERTAKDYWPFVLPALIIVSSVILFPWLFTIWMSLNEWKLGGSIHFAGLSNYAKLFTDERFRDAVWQTIYYTVLATGLPLVIGTFAAVIFHEKFPLRGVLRGLYIMPMMATPVAIALVWVMMFHPQLGVLNYLLSLVGIPPQLWVFSPKTVIPSLALIETWQWSPLVMLIVLGGLASLPTEPYESAMIDGATRWQMFHKITLPLIMPFIMVALILRVIDALKSFDIIFAITQGGPGNASETLNIYLYNTAFPYRDMGYGSALAVVFFIIVIGLSLVMLWMRQRNKWDEQGADA
ncbi:sugar ABC transporter permease [Terrarubrum flagellatum]|uniref:carbohydrate ABC transporter permease n=1 Tax=Terrirubrum flagellatum TaxID=2895980 RepID=UPI0031453683